MPVGLGQALEDWATAPARVREPPGESELACMLYTSGSTGRHKGWMMSRAAIAGARALGQRADRARRAGDVFANHAQFSFGMSLFDIFSSLGAGVPLVLVPDEVRQFADRIVDLISRERVSIWFSGPGILSLMARAEGLEQRDLRALRLVAFAGEVFPAPALTDAAPPAAASALLQFLRLDRNQRGRFLRAARRRPLRRARRRSGARARTTRRA